MMIAQPVIKPIETSYKGFLFRSRLESRWAVFLDTLKVKWDYEPQGYDISGTWYLPDFWIRTWGMFMEIKSQNATQEERDLCAQLSFVKPVLFISGSPWPREYDVTLYIQGEKKIKGMFAEVMDGKQRALCIANKIETGWGLMYIKKPILGYALSKARSARFEHGEKG